MLYLMSKCQTSRATCVSGNAFLIAFRKWQQLSEVTISGSAAFKRENRRLIPRRSSSISALACVWQNCWMWALRGEMSVGAGAYASARTTHPRERLPTLVQRT